MYPVPTAATVYLILSVGLPVLLVAIVLAVLGRKEAVRFYASAIAETRLIVLHAAIRLRPSEWLWFTREERPPIQRARPTIRASLT